MARRFTDFAERIVLGSLLKEQKSENKKLAVQKRLTEAYETEERMKSIREFMNRWNHWREFYFSLGPIAPKTKSQLTMIENSIAFSNEKGMDLNMVIACIHKAYKGRKFRPSFNAVELYGEEFYEKFYEDVLADIDNQDYEDASERRV